MFFDADDLDSGRAFNEEIREQVRASHLMVFLISPDSTKPGAFALSELSFAAKGWRRTSGRLLPVLVEPTPDIPADLGSVSILMPRGDLVAEVLASVAKLRRVRRRRRWAVYGAGALAVAAAAYFLWPGNPVITVTPPAVIADGKEQAEFRADVEGAVWSWYCNHENQTGQTARMAFSEAALDDKKRNTIPVTAIEIGGRRRATGSVILHRRIEARFEWDSRIALQAPRTITFKDTSTGAPRKRTWTIDGKKYEGKQATHAFARAKTYTVKLEVEGELADNRDTHEEKLTLIKPPAPNAAVVVMPDVRKQTLAIAHASLKRIGLRVTSRAKGAQPPGVPKGKERQIVVAVSPKAGTRVRKGSSVVVTWSPQAPAGWKRIPDRGKLSLQAWQAELATRFGSGVRTTRLGTGGELLFAGLNHPPGHWVPPDTELSLKVRALPKSIARPLTRSDKR